MKSVYKKGQKKDPQSYRPISLTLVTGKIMEQIILSAIVPNLRYKQVIRSSQHEAWIREIVEIYHTESEWQTELSKGVRRLT